MAKKSSNKTQKSSDKCAECDREVPEGALSECIECGWGDGKSCESCIDDHMAEEHPED